MDTIAAGANMTEAGKPDPLPAANGAMQPYALTVDKFLLHAAKWNSRQEVVTALPDGSSKRGTYAEIFENAQRGSDLLAECGVRPGSRVATLAWNTQAHFESWYAILGLGGAYLTLNPRLTAEQTASVLARAGADVIIVGAELADLGMRIVEQVPAIRHVVMIDGDTSAFALSRQGLGVRTWDVTSGRVAKHWIPVDEYAVSGLCFTSGTTGDPKGVTYTHRSTYLHTMRLMQADVMGMSRHDTVLAVVPMFHANAWGMPFLAPAVGARLVLPGRKTDGASLAKLIATEEVTMAAGVATVWLGLVDHLEATGGDLPSLKRLIVGGAPLAPALMERLEKRLGVTVQTSWGMTELSPLGTMALPADPERNSAYSGLPSIGIDLLLKDADGVILPQQREVEGHLYVRGPAVVERYLGSTDKATDADGWFSTGDLARIDEAGNLLITGRAKDLIKSGGEWINPAEIEAIVGELADVSLAAVIARPDPKWGERPLLIVEMRKGSALADADLLATLRNRVATWWIPDAVIRISAMPMASTGKIDKMQLRAQYGH